MKTQYKYIEFVDNENGTWSCLNRKHKDRLLIIGYYKPFKEWCVLDVEESVVLSVGCLLDIAYFLKQLNLP